MFFSMVLILVLVVTNYNNELTDLNLASTLCKCIVFNLFFHHNSGMFLTSFMWFAFISLFILCDWVSCALAYRCVNYIVSIGSELPERLDEKPGSLIPRPIKSDTHCVLLHQCWKTLIHRQKLVALHMQELKTHQHIL